MKMKHLIFGINMIFYHMCIGSNPIPTTLTITCPSNITITEGQKTDSATTGWPKVTANSGNRFTVTYFDVNSKGQCPVKTDQITRFFTVTNNLGEQQRCSQLIFVQHIDFSNVRVPKDTSILYPLSGTFSDKLVFPSTNLSSVIISYTDTLSVKRCINPMKIVRIWKIQDKCTKAIRTLTTNINLTGYEDSFIHTSSVTNGVCNADGEIQITPKGEFGPYSYKWNSGDSSANLAYKPAGTYQVTITDRFKCIAVRQYFLKNISDAADAGGRITTINGYHVYPDSIFFGAGVNVTNRCISNTQVLQYGFNLDTKIPGLYKYSFRKTTNPLSGVSTKDILLIQRAILGTQKFTDTLSVFAADVLGNYNVAGSDMLELRKLILGVIPNFTKVDPYYFLRTDFRSVINRNTLLKDLLFTGFNIPVFPKQNIDITALKMGDVDFSYRGTNFAGEEIESRSNNDFSEKLEYFQYTNSKMQTVTDLYLSSGLPAEGIQLALDFERKPEILHSQIPAEFMNVIDNVLLISWSTGSTLNIDESKPIFSVSGGANFHMSNLRENELYLAGNVDVDLILNKKLNSAERAIFKVIPNPVHHIFQIENVESGAEIYIYDELNHQIEIPQIADGIFDASRLLPGVYFYYIHNKHNKNQRGKFIKL